MAINSVWLKQETQLAFRLQRMENMRYTVTKKAFRNWNICGYIYPNGIENVPEMLSCFGSSLEILHVSENFIGELNRTVFQRFTKLKHLHLDYTQVVNFDFSVIQSKKLQIFHISSNSLKRMNNASILKTFTKLEEFRAASNELENTAEIIRYISGQQLKILELSDNFIGHLNASTFITLTKVKEMNLKNTSLQFSGFNPFQALLSLNNLDISYNNLVNCQISDISQVMTNSEPSHKYLDISGNVAGKFGHSKFSLKIFQYWKIYFH